MNIVLIQSTSEPNAVNKNLSTIITLSGELRDQSSIIDPVVTVTGIDAHITTINYAHIPYFGRYYFVTNIESIRTGLWKLSMHVDVLYSFADAIKGNGAIIERNEKEYDLKLNDGLFRTQQNPRIAQYPFPHGFNKWNFVLAVAGN